MDSAVKSKPLIRKLLLLVAGNCLGNVYHVLVELLDCLAQIQVDRDVYSVQCETLRDVRGLVLKLQLIS